MTRPVKMYPADLLTMKAMGSKICMITAYDFPTAQIVEASGIDVVLVGDSLGNVVLGYDSTLPVTMTEQLHHVRAVRRGLKKALLIADMPYLSYQISVEEAIKNGGRFIQEAGAEAVKLEGGSEFLPVIEGLLRARIPVMGHLGLTPQSLNVFGGYKVKGKTKNEADRIFQDALALEKAGVFAIVLEGIPWQLARKITAGLKIPTIGIGAGPHCDGQVLVFHDLTGFQHDETPRFVRQYCNAFEIMSQAVRNYCADVQKGTFPNLKESYGNGKK